MNIRNTALMFGKYIAPTASAFDDIWGWWRADTFSGVTPNVVLTDKSVNGRNMTQAAGTLTAGTAANGQARFVGGATARLTSSATLKSWPVTIITVGLRTNNATCGFFGHTGATGYNGLWNGYETSNANAIYNTNAASNTTAEAGADACYVARIGYGSRVAIVNGVIQDSMQLASIVQTGLVAVELGTQYRGLNLAWQETLVWDRVLSLSELDEVHTYINTRYSMSIPLFSSYTKGKFVINTGDSIASGRSLRGGSDVNVPVEYLGAQTPVKIWYGTPANGFGTSWDTYNLASNNNQLSDQFFGTSTYFGPNTSVGKEYNDRTANTIYLLQSSTGSASVSKISSNAFYDPFDNSLTHLNNTRSFGVLVKNYWRSVGAMQRGLTLMPDLLGICVFLGVNDAADLVASDAFYAQMVLFIAELRKEIGLPTSQSKIILIKEHTSTSPSTYKATIRAACDSLATGVSNLTVVNIDSETLVDGIHPDGTSNISIGTTLASLL